MLQDWIVKEWAILWTFPDRKFLFIMSIEDGGQFFIQIKQKSSLIQP